MTGVAILLAALVGLFNAIVADRQRRHINNLRLELGAATRVQNRLIKDVNDLYSRIGKKPVHTS